MVQPEKSVMPANPMTHNCPDCGAPVQAGLPQCWMCYRPLAWKDGRPSVIRAPGPFSEEAAALAPRYYYKTNVLAILGIILSALLMVPAALIACFVTCLAVAVGQEGHGPPGGDFEAGMVFGIVSGIVVLLLFCLLIGVSATRVVRKTPV